MRDVGELDPNPGAVTGFLCDAGQSHPPAATEGVELQYQQLVYPAFLSVQLSSLKKSVSTGYLYKI